MSPTSIAMALAMARAGADRSTASQIDRVLRANGWNDLGSGLGSLQQILNGHNATWKDDEGTSHSLSLNVVNRAFGQVAGRSSRPISSGSAVRSAPASVSSTTCGTARPRGTSSMAGWPGRRNRIPRLLSPLDVTDATRLVLVNAIYLKANWQHEFSEDGTRNRPFTTQGGTVRVPTMYLLGEQDVPLAHGRGLAGDRAPLQWRRRVLPAGDDADPS